MEIGASLRSQPIPRQGAGAENVDFRRCRLSRLLGRSPCRAPLFGLSQGTESEVLEKVKSAIGNWEAIARANGMNAVDINSFASAFEHPEF